MSLECVDSQRADRHKDEVRRLGVTVHIRKATPVAELRDDGGIAGGAGRLAVQQNARVVGSGSGSAVPQPSSTAADAFEMARRSEWLSGRQQDFVDALLARGSLLQLRKGQVVIGVNEDHVGLYFLVRGAVEVSVPRLTGELFPTHLLAPNRWFGEPAALTGGKSIAEYRARTAAAVLYIPRSAIQLLQQESGDFSWAMTHLLSFSIRDLMEMAGDLAGLSPRKRVISKLLTLSSDPGEGAAGDGRAVFISHAELATLCCVSRASMSVFLGEFEAAGMLRLDYRRILILRRQALLDALNDSTVEE